jgi:hypothetical protein
MDDHNLVLALFHISKGDNFTYIWIVLKLEVLIYMLPNSVCWKHVC